MIEVPYPVTLTQDKIPDVIKEIEDAFRDIPFENSTYQTENFVIASQITPERAYRAIGLRMSAKLRALKEAQYNRLREEIDIEELQHKINDPSTSIFDKRRAQIDINEKLDSRSFTDKLANDALEELNVLYNHFQRLPKFTREQFEQGEQTHFQLRLSRQAQGIQGAQESLLNMTQDIKQLSLFQDQHINNLLDNDRRAQILIWEQELLKQEETQND